MAEFEQDDPSSAEASVRRQAAREHETLEFNRKCNDVEVSGSKAFGDKWLTAKQHLSILDDNGCVPPEILQAALETEDPARVLFELSKDLEKTDELIGMSPIKRAIAIDRFLATAGARTKTALPIDQATGRDSRDDRPSDRDSDEEWNRKEALRERQLRERRRQGMR